MSPGLGTAKSSSEGLEQTKSVLMAASGMSVLALHMEVVSRLRIYRNLHLLSAVTEGLVRRSQGSNSDLS